MRRLSYAVLLFTCAFAFAQDPIAHYTFSGDASDVSGNGNDGTVNGATLTADRFGNADAAYSFDGVDDFISTMHTFSANQVHSVSAWVYWNGTSGDQTAISWFNVSLANRQFFGVNGTGSLIFGDGFQTGTALESAQWVHLVGTYDGTQSRIYIDGALSDISSTGIAYQFDDLIIGRQGSSSSEYWDGLIDDVSIYDQALDAAQVEAIYYSELGPIVEFTFSGDATDVSGNGNDGTVNGAVLTTDRFGNADEAYSFDGVNDDIDFGNGVKPDFPLTVSTWLQPATIGSNQTIFRNDTWDGFGLFAGIYIYMGGDGGVNAQFGSGGVAAASSRSGVISDTKLDTEWNQLVVVYNSASDIKIYINGEVSSTVPDNGTGTTLGYTAATGKLGSRIQNSATVDFFNGSMDDVKVYGVGLSSSEVSDLYQSERVLLNDITAFSFSEETGPAIIDDGNHTVDIEVAFGTDITALTPLVISISAGATLSPESGIEQDFSNPFVYTVTDPDGITAQDWTVNVTIDQEILFEYNFSNNTDDQSGSGIQGSLPNGGTFVADRFGNALSAIELDGATQYVIADNSGLPIITGNAVTFSGWFNLNQYQANSFILSTPGLIAFFDESGHPGFAPQDNVVSNVLESSTVVPLNEWVHFVGTYDGSFTRIYIDGEEVASEQIDKTMNLVDFSSTLGGNISTNFPGIMDDVRLYDRALSASEVSGLYSENEWPVLSVEITGTSLTGEANTDQVSLVAVSGSYYISRYLYDGTIRFQANGTSDLNWGDNELDGFADQDGADITVTEGLYAIRFEPSDNSYFVTEITSVGFLGSARTGDVTGWDDPDTDMVNIGQGGFQLLGVTLYDGEWKIRANDDWGFINWGGPGDGTLDIFGADIPVTAGTYDITVSVGVTLNYSISSTGLEAAYLFNGNATDESLSGNDGTLGDGVTASTFPTLTADRFGNADAAFSFDGDDDYIELGATAFDFSGGLTLSVWANSSSVSQWERFLDLGNATTDNTLIFGRESSTNNIFFTAWDATELSAFGVTGFEENVWKHYVVTQNTDGEINIYIDGVLAGTELTSTLPSGISRSEGFIGIQRIAASEDFAFSGELDDIRIYVRDLSESEIQDLFNEGDWGAPRVTAIASTSGIAGQTIRVYGDQLAETGTVVTLNGTEITPSSVSDKLLFFDVPDIAEGAYELMISNDYGYSLAHDFSVLKTKTSTLSFTDSQISAAIPTPYDIHMADFTDDGYPDLLTYSLDNGDLQYFVNDRSGGFPTSTLLYDGTDGGSEISTVVSADLDRDGDLDIAMFTSSQVHWFPNDGFGGFAPDSEIVIGTGSNFRDLAVGDLNGDGYIDVVAVENGVIQWYQNSGTGDFGDKTTITTSSAASKIVIGDFDNNGHLDIAQANNANYYLVNSGSAFFTELPLATPTNGSDAIAVGSFSEDNYMDLVIGAFNNDNVDVFLNDGGGLLNGSEVDQNITPYTSPIDFAVGDMDGDGDLDFVTAFFNSSAGVVYYENDGTGIFTALEITSGLSQVSRVLTTDMDNDGDLDIVISRESGFISWYENEENSSTIAVAELNFDSNLLDNSGFENHGNLVSTNFTTDRFDQANSAILLDGAQSVDIGTDPELLLASGFTMNLWINPTDNDNGGSIFTSSNSFHQHITSTGFNWRYFQGSAEFFIDGVPVVAPIGTWTMVTWTYDGTKMRFFENGELRHTELVSGDLDIPGNSYGIGGNFDGAIDEFSWIDGVLSQEEVTAIYNDDLLVHYAFSGNANDETSNARDAIVNGATLTVNRFGNENEAYMFDGDDEIDGPLLSEKPENLTLSTWFKYPEGGAENLHYLFDLQGLAGIVVNQNNLESTFKLGENFVTTIANTETVTRANTWHLGVATYDGTSIKLYLDGQLVAENVNPDGIQYDLPEYGIRIGRPDFAAQDYFLGYLDDVKVHARALSDFEIQELYNENGWDKSAINSFGLVGEANQGSIDPANLTIDLTLGRGFDITNMIAEFTLSDGAIATINSTDQESGVTANDYSSPIVYQVTGDDGSMSSWVVTVTYDDALLVYYPFNGNAEDQVAGYNGTLNGDVVLAPDRFGNEDQAYSFDGDLDFIQTDFNPADDEAFSISLWTFWDESFADFREMLGFTTDDETKITYFGVASDDNLRARGNLGVSMPIGEWNHLVFTYDGSSTFQCFVDNELVFSQNDLADYPFGPLTIGAFSRGGGESWKGDLDDIRFFGRVLSVDDVDELFREGGWVPEADDLFAEYSFSGDASDLGPNGFNGILGNGSDTSQDPDLTTDRFGFADNAYAFNVSDFITYSGTESTDFGDEITVAAWIYNNEIAAVEPEFLSNDLFDFKLSAGTSDDNAFRTLKGEIFGKGFLATGELNPNTWYHVAFTFKRAEALTLYVNGVEIGSNTSVADQAIGTASQALRSGSGGYNGVIDELVIYDVALSAQSINDLFVFSANDLLSSENEVLSYELTAGSVLASSGYTELGEFDGNKYYLSTSAALWNDAQAAAAAVGGHLAAMNSQEENDFLSGNIGVGDLVWVGGSDAAIEGQFKWVDGSPFSFTNWRDGEPNGGINENYIEFDSEGIWNDLTDGELPFVVEVPTYEGIIDADNQTIALEMPSDLDFATLVASFELSSNATAQVAGVAQQNGITSNDHTFPFVFTVEAQDGSTKNWIVTTSVDDDLLAYYPFSGTANDESGNAHDAFVNGATLSEDRFENAISAYSFNGTSDYIQGSDQVFFDGINQASISLWFNTNSVSKQQKILWFDACSRIEILGDGNLYVEFCSSSVTPAFSVPIEANEWIHVAMTYNDNTELSRLYINGSPVEDDTGRGIISPKPLAFIGSENGTADFMDGSIDDIRLYDRALSAEEVLGLYNENGWPFISEETDITLFTVEGQVGNSVIDPDNHAVSFVMPFGTSLDGLAPTIEVSTNAIISPISGLAQNFSSSVEYTVSAEERTITQVWTVTATNAPSPEADFLSYSLDGAEGVIDEVAKTISVELPNGTSFNALTATFTLSNAAQGATISGTPQESGTTVNNFINPVTYAVTAEDGTTVNWIVTVTEGASNATEILSYSFIQQTGTATIGAGTIDIEVAFGTSLDNLVASFALSGGATATVGGTEQVSGTNGNDFTSDVTYVVTALDGTTTQNWVVSVSVGQNTATDITNFDIPNQIGEESINATSHTIQVVMLFETDVTNLSPTIELSSGASVVPNSDVAQNFTNDVTYTVTSEDGANTQDWTVAVVVLPNSATDIVNFDIPGQGGDEVIDVDAHTVAVSMPSGSVVTALVPTIEVSENATINPLSGVQQDFTNSVAYTVTAEDATTQNWIVTVSVNANPTALDLSAATIEENAATGTLIGTFSTTDADNDTFIYSFVGGTDDASFSIENNNELRSNTVFDFEAGEQRNILVRTDDQSGGIFDQAFTITITDITDENLAIYSSIVAPPTHERATGDFTVGVTIDDGDGINAVVINHKKASADDYTEEGMADAGGGAYTFAMSGTEDMDNTGVQYFFSSTDNLGNQTQTAVFSTASIVDENSEPIPSVSAGTTIADYSIVAFPYQSANVNQLTDDLGSYDNENWRLIRYSSGSYQDLTSTSTLAAGVGYWFIYKDATVTTIDVGGQSVALNENGVFTINLSAGFNLIGNPFKGTLNWGQVLQHNLDNGVIVNGAVNGTTLDGWTSTWVDRTSLSSYEGAFLNMNSSVTNFEIPVSAVTNGGRIDDGVPQRQEVKLDNPEWEIRLFFNTPSYSYSMGGIGMHPNAQDGDDLFDKALPPKFFLYLDLQFEDGNTRSVKQSDYYKEWNFTVPNNLQEESFELTWDIPVSSSKTIVLVDAASKKLYDLSQTGSITLPNDPTVEHKLYFGDKMTIFNNLDLPFDALFSIYPNPVQDEVTLDMYTSENKNLPVELISINGQAIPLGQVQLNKGMSSTKINLATYGIKNGIYFIKVGETVMTKIIKK